MAASPLRAKETDSKDGLPTTRGGVRWLRDRLRTAILSGEIPASAARTQTQLADLLGVSRTPLREALRILELEHLIVRQSNGRFRVADFSAEEIEQLGVMLATLESDAVLLTVPLLTDVDDAVLEGLYAKLVRLARFGEWSEFERPHREFHRTLTAGVGPSYTEELTRLWDQVARYVRVFEDDVMADGRNTVSQREHRGILDAAEARDAESAASRIAWQHARTALEIANKLDPAFPLDRLRTTLEAENASQDPTPCD